LDGKFLRHGEDAANPICFIHSTEKVSLFLHYFNEPWGDIPLNSSTEQGKGWLTSVNFRQAVYIRHVLTHNEMINGVGK
jgi:hypothetical protein